MKNIPLPLSFTLLLGAAAAQAETGLVDSLTFRGFGTLGVLQTDSDEGEYRRIQQPVGASRSATLRTDSNLGLQADVTVNSWLSGSFQTLAAQRTETRPAFRTAWAFVKLTPVDAVNLRVGKLAVANFLVSDSRRIGYANTALHAPDEVYGLDVMDGGMFGADVSGRLNLGAGTLVASASAGDSVASPLGLPKFDVKKVRGVNLVWDGDWYQARVGYLEAKPDLTPLAFAFAPFVEPGFVLGDAKYKFSGIGISAERGGVLFQSEFVRRRDKALQSFVGADAWYAQIGYRLDNLTPYVSYARLKPLSQSSAITHPQRTLAAGVRWDAFAKAAIKLQVDRVDTSQTPGTSFVTPQVMTAFGPAPLPVTRPVTAVGASIDFVF